MSLMRLLVRVFSGIYNYCRFSVMYGKYKEYTMVPKTLFVQNLSLIIHHKSIKGCVVECGVWRGGMIAAIAQTFGNDRNYHLFDSFEGLPDAKPVDGSAAIEWQKNTNSETYFDNCSAEMKWATAAMEKSKSTHFTIHKGWFNQTLPAFTTDEQIAVLRLDGDWYESTMDCLVNLYPKVAQGGIIVIDDYYLWDGCSKAVHDYLSSNKLSSRISQFRNGHVHYIVKRNL